MSAGDWAWWAAGVFIFVFGLRMLPQMWRNDLGLSPDTAPPWWAWGVRTWRATQRAGVVVYPALALGIVGVPLQELPSNEIVSAVGTAALGLGAVCMWTGFSIALFNRPRWAVFPHHRHQKGLIAELFGNRSDPTPPAKYQTTRDMPPRRRSRHGWRWPRREG